MSASLHVQDDNIYMVCAGVAEMRRIKEKVVYSMSAFLF